MRAHERLLGLAAAQIAPVLLDRGATLRKVLATFQRAAEDGARLVAFPEALIPGYPTWLARTGGAVFDDPLQKELHARYLDQALELPGPELDQLRTAAGDLGASAVVGVIERGAAAGRGTLWCTALSVHPDGSWLAHRKLVPTYEERLAWGHGDGHGLRVQQVGDWKVGALNCWENWMPAARMAMYAGGEEVHVAIWPGAPGLTRDISRFTAREGRVFVVAASGVLRADELPEDLPAREALVASAEDGLLHTGGSRIVAPDGRELASLDDPVEGVITAELDRALLDGERQNFDPAGHYHRSDVFHIEVDRGRSVPVTFRDA
jgi:nitrilase